MRLKLLKLFLTFLFFFSALWINAQNISVKSFRTLTNDQTARVTDPVIDQNGEKCALIKVVTNQSGFVWEGGMLGISEVIKKTGEYWVFVPRGSKKITIKHEQLGVLRDYIYPESIQEATVYEMKLTTGQVKTVVEEKKLPFQWLVIDSEPKDARVFIDDKFAGRTPFQRKYQEGQYTYRLEKNLHYNRAGKVNLEDDKKKLNLELKPRFGSIEVTSEPEEGMSIYLDGENTGKKTPATLEEVASGEHAIELQSPWYQPETKQLTISDGQTTSVQFNLEPVFASVSVTTNPSAGIFVDDQRKGKGSWNGRLRDGIYTIKAEKDKYYSQSREVEIKSGEEKELSFDLKAKTGSADIVTTPMDATVYVDGKKQGTTPFTVKNVLIGKHELSVKKEGYESLEKNIIIEENQTIEIDTALQKKREKTYEDSELKDIHTETYPEPSEENITKKNYKGGPANMFLSLLVPGLGDKYVSDKSGTGRTLTTYGLIAGGLACKFFSDYQYKNYHNAALQSEMGSYYESANKYNKLYYILTASGIIYWIYDIIWVADKGFKNRRNQRSYTGDFDLNYDPAINGPAFSLTIEF